LILWGLAHGKAVDAFSPYACTEIGCLVLPQLFFGLRQGALWHQRQQRRSDGG
jgi:hypothetical protein